MELGHFRNGRAGVAPAAQYVTSALLFDFRASAIINAPALSSEWIGSKSPPPLARA